jgi:hypothetical protein
MIKVRSTTLNESGEAVQIFVGNLVCRANRLHCRLDDVNHHMFVIIYLLRVNVNRRSPLTEHRITAFG